MTETNKIRAISPINKFRVNFKSSSFVFDNENIECVDIITAVNIKGIAGKEISWIKVSPSEFKLAVAFGRKNPRSSENGSI